MATRDMPFAPGTPSWVDVFSSDPEKSKLFYGRLFDWTFEDSGPEYGGYVTFYSGGRRVAGMSPNNSDSAMPDLWATYIAVDDVGAAVGQATAAGATVSMPAMQVGELGSMAVLQDTSGGTFGLWQAASMTGFERYNENNAVGWNEYHSKDFNKTIEFYQAVFGYEYDVTGDSDDFRYRTAKIAGAEVAGFMDSVAFLPEQMPSHWTVYVTVADVDKSIETLLELGGSVMRPAEDSPFGRLADVVDSTGAAFKLHSTKLAGAGIDEKLDQQADAALSARTQE